MPITTVVALIRALMQFAPELPELATAAETTIDLLKSGTAPTAAQQAQIDAALDAANAAVQNA